MRATTRVLIAILLGVAQLGLLSGGDASPAHAGTLSATVRIQQIVAEAGSSPTESILDADGLTGHFATASSRLTVVSIMKSPRRLEDGVGLVFFNPTSGDVKWYPPIAGGTVTGLDVSRGRAVRSAVGETYQAGDVWVSAQGGPEDAPLYVNLRGSDRFRAYQLSGGDGRARIDGLTVDPTSGMVYFADQRSPATINRLDPATSTVTSWLIGGTPHDLTIDSLSGVVYATVSGLTVAYVPTDAVVRLDPAVADPLVPNLAIWPLPGALGFALGPFAEPDSPPDSIDVDGQGNVWFVESQSKMIGRLDPSAGVLTEMTWTELLDSRQGSVSRQGSGEEAFGRADGRRVATRFAPIATTTAVARDLVGTPQRGRAASSSAPPPTASPIATAATTAPATSGSSATGQPIAANVSTPASPAELAASPLTSVPPTQPTGTWAPPASSGPPTVASAPPSQVLSGPGTPSATAVRSTLPADLPTVAPLPPTATPTSPAAPASAAPTFAAVPPTFTPVPPTATLPPPTATPPPPTATPPPPTATSVPPTATSVPPTVTPVPPTATPVPPTTTPTSRPATSTPTKIATTTSSPAVGAASSSLGMVAGGGIVAVPGGKAEFGFFVQRKLPSDPLKGQLDVVNQANGEKVHATQITSLLFSGGVVTIEGGGTKNGAPCSFRVTLEDRGNAGSTDTFQMSGTCANVGPGAIAGGNVIIQRS